MAHSDGFQFQLGRTISDDFSQDPNRFGTTITRNRWKHNHTTTMTNRTTKRGKPTHIVWCCRVCSSRNVVTLGPFHSSRQSLECSTQEIGCYQFLAFCFSCYNTECTKQTKSLVFSSMTQMKVTWKPVTGVRDLFNVMIAGTCNR